jgi:hypothetical protein
MTPNIGITLTCYKRLDYLLQVLDSLKKSVDYAQYNKLKLYVSIDYFDDTIINSLQNINWIPLRYTVNRPPFGCNKNTKNAILMGLSENDAIIHLEDDTVLSVDAIDFFIKHLTNPTYLDDPNILCVGGYNRTDELSKENLNEVVLHNDFVCWGLAFWKHKINTLLNNWTPLITRTHDYESWDSYLNRIVFKQNSHFKQLRPLVSRIRNIGAKDGTYTTGAAMMMNMDVESWHRTYQSTKYIAEDLIK